MGRRWRTTFALAAIAGALAACSLLAPGEDGVVGVRPIDAGNVSDSTSDGPEDDAGPPFDSGIVIKLPGEGDYVMVASVGFDAGGSAVGVDLGLVNANPPPVRQPFNSTFVLRVRKTTGDCVNMNFCLSSRHSERFKVCMTPQKVNIRKGSRALSGCCRLGIPSKIA